MIDLKRAIIAFTNEHKTCEWSLNSSELMAKVTVYNQALKDVAKFIEMYENGEIEQEFIITLEKQQEKK